MKKIIGLIIISLFTIFNFTNYSLALWKLNSQEKTLIRSTTWKYIDKAFNKYWTHWWIEKLVKIVKKIEILRENFKNRNIKNKEKIFKILECIKIKIKTELWNISSNMLNSKDRALLSSIWIIRQAWVNSKFLDSWVEVYKQGKEKIDTSKWGIIIYYIRFLLEDIRDVSNPKNHVYLKKALYKNWKLSQNKFVAKLWTYINDDLYSIWYDKTNPPKYCYNRVDNSKYKNTKFSWIKSDSLAYVSTSLNELVQKIKDEPNWKFPANKWWDLCQPWNFWVKFYAKQNLTTELLKIPWILNQIK
jgi:hypothetical protein